MTAVVGLVRFVRASDGSHGLSRWRFVVLAVGVVAMGALLVWRLATLQVLEPDRYVRHGENQRIRSAELAAERGAIVDRNGVELAVSSPRPSVYADPRLVVDPRGTAEAIAAVIGADIEIDVLERRLSNPDAKFAWMVRQLDETAAAEVMALQLPGLYVTEEQTRLAPSGDTVARALLGRTDIDGNGLSGLEYQYDGILTGTEGQIVVERGLVAGAGKPVTIPDGKYELITPVAGDSVVLTIDRTVQFEVEKLLEAHLVEAGAASGTVIVSRPRTGEILAMTTVVRADNGVVSVAGAGDNRAVTWIVEPGSISKPLALAALIEEGLASPNTTVEVTEELEIYDRVFTDEIRHETNLLTAAEVLESSSNVGMALLSNRLGKEGMHRYLDRFGIGAPTILDFPGESAGILHEVDSWSGVSLPSAAIGYGFAATPLQMLRAYNVFANGGMLVEPHLVTGIRRADGEFDVLSPREGRRVLSEPTVATMSALLAGVVENGTGQLASIPGYEIAGKTGTARIAQPGGGYEDENGEVHLLTSFAGYLPATAPELSVIVMIEDPSGDASGGRLAAPLFGEVSNFALQHFRIPPASEIPNG